MTVSQYMTLDDLELYVGTFGLDHVDFGQFFFSIEH